MSPPSNRKLTLGQRQLVFAEVTGSNPIEALIFFRLLLSNCLNWKIYSDDHSSLSSTTGFLTTFVNCLGYPQLLMRIRFLLSRRERSLKKEGNFTNIPAQNCKQIQINYIRSTNSQFTNSSWL